MNFEEKQEKFEYRKPEDLYVHGEPFSPARWNEELLKIGGRCPYGDARLRIVWGGTAKKRAYAQLPTKSVEVMSIKYPGPIPKIRELVGFTWYDGKGGSHDVKRQDEIPAGKLSIPRYDYYELGMLRWVLERKYTPEELIAIGQYPDPRSSAAKAFGVQGGRRYIPPMDPRGEYVGLYPLETPDKKYWEPEDRWFTTLKQTIQETEKASEGDRLQALNQYMDDLERAELRQEQEQKEAEDTIWEEAVIESEKKPKGRVIFT